MVEHLETRIGIRDSSPLVAEVAEFTAEVAEITAASAAGTPIGVTEASVVAAVAVVGTS